MPHGHPWHSLQTEERPETMAVCSEIVQMMVSLPVNLIARNTEQKFYHQ
jgi:hypothetical protein